MPRDKSFLIYVLVVLLTLIIGSTILFILSDGPGYVRAPQLVTYLQTKPEACRPLARAMLRRHMLENRRPLRPADVRAVLREIDADDCAASAEQLDVLDAPETRHAD